MSQVTDYVMPGSPLTMAALAAELNADFAAIISRNSGAVAPSNPVVGMFWLDTSGGATAYILKIYTAGGWLSLYGINSTTGALTRIYGILDEDNMTSDSAILPPSQQSVKAYVDTNTVKGVFEFTNLSFTATVAAKALTVALKGSNGSDPSASNVVTIPFRSATLTTNGFTRRNVTAALSVVLSSGSTLGFTAALAGRIYVWAIDNAGTVVLGLSRTADIFPEDKVVTTTAEGGAGAADSATTMYSTAAQTSKACRCIGYIEITTGAVAGEWDNAPTKVQVMGPGIRKTGDVVQVVEATTTSSGSTSTTIPADNTIPQNTEGAEVLTKAITPVSSINKLYIDAHIPIIDASAAHIVTAALFQDTTANALSAACTSVNAANYPKVLSVSHSMVAGTVGATTFKLRIGPNGDTGYWLRTHGGDYFTGVATARLKITEVFA